MDPRRPRGEPDGAGPLEPEDGVPREPKDGPPDKPEHAAMDESPPEPPEEPVVELPIEDFLDLHPFRPREIPEVVDSYLEAAAERGFTEVRLIHGKGIGFQRDRVRKLLSGHRLVESYRDAPAGRGHWGATLVRLRSAGSDRHPSRS
jgi:dsDNA-specific endonuclease/ATPase MutS2